MTAHTLVPALLIGFAVLLFRREPPAGRLRRLRGAPGLRQVPGLLGVPGLRGTWRVREAWGVRGLRRQAPTEGSTGTRTVWRPMLMRRERFPTESLDVAGLAERVAALTRAGLPPARVWDLLAATTGPAQLVCAEVAAHLSAGGSTGAALRAVPGPPALRWLSVAQDGAERAGAPLADVLDGFADALREEEQAAAERETALAGPRATATVLAALPLAGLGLGYLLGANPLGALLGTGPGRVCLVAGTGLWLTGRSWTRALIRRAERAGQP
jgi:tight adherence protein B